MERAPRFTLHLSVPSLRPWTIQSRGGSHALEDSRNETDWCSLVSGSLARVSLFPFLRCVECIVIAPPVHLKAEYKREFSRYALCKTRIWASMLFMSHCRESKGENGESVSGLRVPVKNSSMQTDGLLSLPPAHVYFPSRARGRTTEKDLAIARFVKSLMGV